MAPKYPLHIAFYRLWMERLEDCCKFCGELHDYPLENVDSNFVNKKSEEANEKEYSQAIKKGAKRCKQDVPHFQKTNTQKFSCEKSRFSLAWTPYKRQSLQNTHRNRGSFKRTDPIRVVYSEKEVETFNPTLRHLLQTRTHVEFIVDKTSNDEPDDADLLDDLIDAYASQQRKKSVSE